MSRMIFPNLPVADVQRSREFWTSLGFEINESYSNDDAIAVVVNELASVMLLRTDFFHGFHATSPATGTEVLVALGCESRDEVDALYENAKAAGATAADAPTEQGPMYGGSFRDLDGHIWEFMVMEQV